MKTFDLNIEKILENWEVYHAVREIIANALDEQILTNTSPISITQTNGAWCIRDYGRGLNYHHLTQNENPEKLTNDKVIGRFGVGLKDALATLYRHNIRVEIRSKHGIITLKESTKGSFSDIVTLHAQIDDAADMTMLGTAFYLYGCSTVDIEKAKAMFLCFSDEKMLEQTSYGEIIEKSGDIANIYINGVKVAEEHNFAFSYNITSLSKQIKKALNRERTNVGRTAYADRIKSILIEATNEDVICVLSSNLESMSDGTQCDEIKWVDVASHAVQILNEKEDTIFVTPSELASTSGSTGEIIENSGKRIVFVPENVKAKAEQESDTEISTIKTVVQEYNDSFSYSFVDVASLTSQERANWDKLPALLKQLDFEKWLDKICISEKLKEDMYDSTVGVWDPQLQKIIILRSQLIDRTAFFGTVIHEIIHAQYGANDVSRYFEIKLTEMIGILASLILATPQQNSRGAVPIGESENPSDHNNFVIDNHSFEPNIDDNEEDSIIDDFFDFDDNEDEDDNYLKFPLVFDSSKCLHTCEFYQLCSKHQCDCPKSKFDAILDTLTPREKHVIELLFGLLDGRCRTLEEVGKEYDITRERIKQIKAKALRKLRHPSRGRRIYELAIAFYNIKTPYKQLYRHIFGQYLDEETIAIRGIDITKAISLGKSSFTIYSDLSKNIKGFPIPKEELDLWEYLECQNVYDILQCSFGTSTISRLQKIVELQYLYNTFNYLHQIGYSIPNVDVEENTNLDYSKAVVNINNLSDFKSLSTPIDALALSVRSFVCLKRVGIDTLGDLVSKTEEEIIKVRNLGIRNFEEVKEKIESLGLRFGLELNDDSSKILNPIDNMETFLDSSIEVLDLSVRAFNCLKRAGIETVRDITLQTDEDIITIRNMGKKAYEEIKSVLALHGLQLKQS